MIFNFGHLLLGFLNSEAHTNFFLQMLRNMLGFLFHGSLQEIEAYLAASPLVLIGAFIAFQLVLQHVKPRYQHASCQCCKCQSKILRHNAEL